LTAIKAGTGCLLSLGCEAIPSKEKKMKTSLTLTAAALLVCSPAWAADDAAMMKLASNAGCLTCHHIESGAKGPDGLPPIGPAWREVAAKYRGEKGAQEALTLTVMAGSNPYASHWKGKVSGLAMPPNAVAIGSDDARSLVGWILSLPAQR
jgi:cytochrome c